MNASAAIDYFAGLADTGIDHAIFSLQNVTHVEPFEVLASEIIPVVSQWGA